MPSASTMEMMSPAEAISPRREPENPNPSTTTMTNRSTWFIRPPDGAHLSVALTRHRADADRENRLAAELSPALAHAVQRLLRALADGYDQPPPIPQLRDQRLRHYLGRAVDHDPIEGPLLRPAPTRVPRSAAHLGVLEGAQTRL